MRITLIIRLSQPQAGAWAWAWAELGNRRWKPFNRIVDGQRVLSAPERIVRDLLSGIQKYSRNAGFISIFRSVPCH